MKLDSLMRMRIVYKMLRIVIQAGSRLKKATVGAGGWPGQCIAGAKEESIEGEGNT